jgi:hypothetical protein
VSIFLLPPLIVTTARPDPATLAFGARAGGHRNVLGCRIHLYSCRSRCSCSVCYRENASVVTWNSSMSSIGQAWRDRVFVFLVVLLWWQEVWQGRALETGISNKVVLPFSWRLCASVLRCSTGRLQVKLSVRPAW